MRVLGEALTAKVWKDGNIMESKAINVMESSTLASFKLFPITLHLPERLSGGEQIFTLMLFCFCTVKPKTPTIKSVNKSEGNFEVKWTSNMEGFLNNEMTAVVTYYKKGETEKVGTMPQ